MSSEENKDDKDHTRDRDQDDHTRPGIPRPGQQQDQQQVPLAPLQPDARQQSRSNQWIPPTTGNPDLDPAAVHNPLGPLGGQTGNPNVNPLTPDGMLFDPRRLIDSREPSGGINPNMSIPPGARFDPFGPPDPSMVGPGRGPFPDSNFGNPDPDHFQPPGQPQPPNLGGGKGLKFPWPPGRRGGPGCGFPPPGGSSGSPFL